MLAAFAAFAMLLAAMGLYGVMSYLVTQSTHDIGVLMALGALPGDVIRLVLGQGMGLAAIGILAGMAGATMFTRVLASMLFGVSATDSSTFAAVPVLLAAVAFAATFFPAWRTTRVDPMAALREE
jgi:putative ABC transport system permease protein